MAINYKIVKIKNPKGIEGTNYYAGKFVKTSDYTFKEIVQDIEESTTCTEADAAAVLKALKKVIRKGLLAGRRVVLDDIGALQVTLRGKCYSQDAMSAEDFSPSDKIKGIAVNFRPEASMLKDLRLNYKLNRISSEAMA